MRNAFGLMLMSVAAATLIAAGGWFWTSHKSVAAPQTFAAASATPAPVAAKPASNRDPIRRARQRPRQLAAAISPDAVPENSP